MPLEKPTNWWKPFNKEEKMWLSIAVVWGIIMFIMMPLGHLWNQNVSEETYKTNPGEFREVTERFINKHKKIGSDGQPVMAGGMHVVNAPDITTGEDVFLIAEAWRFRPVLIFKKGKTYRVHMSSLDFQHGFSLQPQNLNFQVLPGYDFVITFTPNETGTFHIVCNEYCFYAGPKSGHDTMVGQITVEE